MHLLGLKRLGLFIISLISSMAYGYEVIPGEYIVKLKNPTSLKSARRLDQVFQGRVEVVSEKLKLGLVKRPVVEMSAHALQDLRNNPQVEYVEPNQIYRINRTPNDPKFGLLWGMRAIEAEKAWDITTGSKNVVVAIIDTGVDYTHPDIAPNMWVNTAEKNGRANVDDDRNGFVDDVYGYDFVNKDGDPKDDQSHGTHCAGTIGAKGNDGIGVVGVNHEVSIMAVKFLSASGSGSLADAVKAIDYARENHANIMSNSWGGGGFSQSLKDAIEEAKDAGIIFIAAAGNESNDNDRNPSYPASYNVDNVVSVAAIDEQGVLADFSNYGRRTVHIAAPGVDIESSVLRGQYDSYSGTSMATPHVSGVAALVLSKEPNLSYTDLRNRLLRTATPSSQVRTKVSTGGVLNAYNAVANIQAPADPNDPANWSKKAERQSTAHPYADRTTRTFTVRLTGASKIAVHFDRFELEEGYDFVTFKDENGNVLGQWSGNNDGAYSPIAEGDTIILEFSTDESVTKYGFDIDEVAYQ